MRERERSATVPDTMLENYPYKLGDRVRLTSHGYSNLPRGAIGVVTRIAGVGLFDVDFSDSKYEIEICVADTNLEPEMTLSPVAVQTGSSAVLDYCGERLNLPRLNVGTVIGPETDDEYRKRLLPWVERLVASNKSLGGAGQATHHDCAGERQGMNVEIIARVDAWLESRRADPEWKRQASMLESRRWNIIGSWNGVASRLRAWPGDPGEQAAATGILLALVRESWSGCDVEVTVRSDGSATVIVDGDSLAIGKVYHAPSLGEGLVVALESAPR